MNGSRQGEKPTVVNVESPRKSHDHEDPPPGRLLVLGTVLFYLVAALVMVVANKWVLNAIPVPAFFLFCQLAIAVVLLRAAAVFGFFSLPRLDLRTCFALWPLVTVNVVGLLFNTYCLQFVDASFYQVARGLVLPFTVFFSFILLGSRSSIPTLISVAIVCFGFFLGVSAEHMTVHVFGIVMGVASSVTTSVHAIVVKRSLAVVPSSLDLAYYSNLLSAAAVLPVTFVAGEVPTILSMVTAYMSATQETAGEAFQLKTFVTGALVTGIFGFLICIAGFLSIKVTSPVTHMISSACRGVLQTFLGSWLFGDVITTGRASGIAVILVGSILYTYTRDQEMRKPKPEDNPGGTELATNEDSGQGSGSSLQVSESHGRRFSRS